MLRAFFEIGKVAENKGFRVRDPLSNIDKVFVLCLDENLNYTGIRVEEFKYEEQWKYLYAMIGNAKSIPGFTPTIVKTKKKLKEELSEEEPKTLKWLSSIVEKLFGNPLESIDKIKEDLKEEVENLNKVDKILITIEIDGKYLGEMPEVVEKLENLIRKWYMDREGGKGICSLCLEEKEKVIGDYFPITFYTVDNPAYAPYLDKKLAYRHMPLCPDCLETVKKGYDAARSYFKFRMTRDLEYLFIPEGNAKKIEDLAEVLKDRKIKQETKYGDIDYGEIEEIDPEQIITILKKRESERLGDKEINPEQTKETFKIEDDLRVLLLFLEEDQNATRILHSIEDVFPSRLGYIYKLREEIENKFMSGEKQFSYETIDRLAPDKADKDSFFTKKMKNNIYKCIHSLTPDKADKDSFFTILRAIFLGEKVEPSAILLSGFRKSKKNNLKLLCYNFAVSYLFIKKAMEEKDMAEFNKLEEEEDPENFFMKYFEGDEVLVGLALLGFLVAYVETVQWARGYTPSLYLLFREFSLDWHGVEELMRELMNKATKYNLGEKFYTLYAKATKRLGFEGRMGKKRDDINTALCVGYGIGKNFKSGGEQDEQT